MRLAAALIALLPLAASGLAQAQTAPRTPAPFTIVPLVELSTAQYALAHMQTAPAQAAIDRAAAALARTQLLAGAERMRLAGELLMQVRDSRAALAGMRDAEAQALLATTIQTLRSQPHY